MAIVMEVDQATAAKEEEIFDQIQTARDDATKLLAREDSYMDVSHSNFHFASGDRQRQVCF